jgi:hypothetical protein
MKNLSSNIFRLALLSVVCTLGGLAIQAQNKAEVKEKNKGFCSDNWSSDGKESYRELREMNVSAAGVLDVDSGRNGGISVKGESRSDVLVRACVQAWGQTADAAKATVAGVKVSTAGGIRADGPEESNYSVSFEILVPRSTDVRLKAHNGGISLSSVDGNLEFETTNGGVHLDNVSGDVKGRTVNGGVNVALSGNTWRGNGLDVQTSNGGVHLSMPDNYAANVEAGTVNGGFSSDIAGLNTEKDERGRSRATKVATSLNGGGAPIRVNTTNGGIRISSSEGSTKN